MAESPSSIEPTWIFDIQKDETSGRRELALLALDFLPPVLRLRVWTSLRGAVRPRTSPVFCQRCEQLDIATILKFCCQPPNAEQQGSKQLKKKVNRIMYAHPPSNVRDNKPDRHKTKKKTAKKNKNTKVPRHEYFWVLGDSKTIYQTREHCSFCRLIYAAIECSAPLYQDMRSTSTVCISTISGSSEAYVTLVRPDFKSWNMHLQNCLAQYFYPLPRSAKSATITKLPLTLRLADPFEAAEEKESPSKPRNKEAHSKGGTLFHSCSGDISKIDGILQQCLADHCTSNCQRKPKMGSETELIVFDTLEMCLRRIKLDDPYVVIQLEISHCGITEDATWKALPKLGIGNKFRPGFLQDTWLRLPRVLQQAIKLVRGLQSLGSQRYLWIQYYCSGMATTTATTPRETLLQLSIIYGRATLAIFPLNSYRLLRHEEERDAGQFARDIELFEQQKHVRINIQGSPKTRRDVIPPEEFDEYRRLVIAQMNRFPVCPRRLFSFNDGFVFSCAQSPRTHILSKMGIQKIVESHRPSMYVEYEESAREPLILASGQKIPR
jgi:hypothetical protein